MGGSCRIGGRDGEWIECAWARWGTTCRAPTKLFLAQRLHGVDRGGAKSRLAGGGERHDQGQRAGMSYPDRFNHGDVRHAGEG